MLPSTPWEEIQPSRSFLDELSSNPEIALVCAGLGLAPSQLLHVSRNRMDVLVEVSHEDFLAFRPDMAALARVPACRVLSVTAAAPPSSDYDFTSRAFAPAVGVDEDP